MRRGKSYREAEDADLSFKRLEARQSTDAECACLCLAVFGLVLLVLAAKLPAPKDLWAMV